MHHATDEVGGIQRHQVDAVGRQGTDGCEQPQHLGLRGAGNADSLGGGDGRKAQALARTQGGQPRKIGADHGGDLRVAPRGLGVGQQYDGLAGTWHLDGARHRGVRHDLGGTDVFQPSTFQANAHAVSLRGDAILATDQGHQRRSAEMVDLRPRDEADRTVIGVRQLPQHAVAAPGIATVELQAHAGSERTAIDAAESGTQVGRCTAHHRRYRQPGNRDRCDAAMPHPGDAQGLAFGQRD